MKPWQLGELNRYRVKCGTIDRANIVAKTPLDAAVIALVNSPNSTLDAYFFDVYCNYGYSNGKETMVTINTDKVLKKAGYKSC